MASSDPSRPESATETGFVAAPFWLRKLRRWRRLALAFVLRDKGRRYIIPPGEWDQEGADAAIRRGHELAEKHGW